TRVGIFFCDSQEIAAAQRVDPEKPSSSDGMRLATRVLQVAPGHSIHLNPLKEAQMRKNAPALMFTLLFAVSSGSALAMGDRHKEKKATTDKANATQSTPASSSSYNSGTSASVN